MVASRWTSWARSRSISRLCISISPAIRDRMLRSAPTAIGCSSGSGSFAMPPFSASQWPAGTFVSWPLLHNTAPDGIFDLGPGLETAAFEGQRAQDLPPRFDQVQVSRVLGLEHELPARVGQSEEQHVGGAVDVEVVHHGVDPRDIGFDPALDRAEEIDPVR